jgi:hypothetical protein
MARHSELRLTPRTVTSDRRARNEERTALILRDAQGPYARRGMALEFDRFAFFSDAVYAIALTLTVLFVTAERRGLLVVTVPRDVYRFGVVASTLPVVVFVLSIPLAAAVNSTVAPLLGPHLAA